MTEQQKIRSQRKRLLQKLEKTHQDIQALQQLCMHPDVMKTHKADTGNYDRSADQYWVQFECPDCGKKWIEEQ